MTESGEGKKDTSSQRGLGPQRVKNPALFTPCGPSLRWGDEHGVGTAR